VIGKIRNVSPTSGSTDLIFQSNRRLLVGYAGTPDELQVNSNNDLTIVSAVAGELQHVVRYGSNKARILNGVFSTGHWFAGNAQSFPDHDKNLRLASEANITFNSTTGEVAWDDHILFVMPWINQSYNRINVSSSPQTLEEEEMLIVAIDRDIATTTTADVPFIFTININGRAGEAFKQNDFVLAFRKDNVVYLWDGTRVESGQTVKLGATPPPDGSVSHVKLADEVIEFHNAFFRNFVSEEGSDEWENKILLETPGAFTYTAATGIVQYPASTDLSEVRVGDVVLFINTDYDPTSAGQRAFTREPIVAVNNGADNVTIAVGLDPTIGSTSRWNGAIARGNKVTQNNVSTPITYTYAPAGANPGRVSFSGNFSFTQYQVRPGYVFIDTSGQRWTIIARDTSGSGSWIEIHPGLTSFDDGTPTSVDHGSIETNNNPYNEKLADMRVVAGAEFIPIHGSGVPDMESDFPILSADPITLNNASGISPKYYPLPHDKRVRIRQEDAPVDTSFSALAPYSAHNINPGDAYTPTNNDAGFVEFVGVCTGLVPVYSAGGSSSTTPFIDIWIDGEKIEDQMTVTNVEYLNTYGGDDHHVYRLACGEEKTARLLRMGYGIHHVRISVPANGGIKGVYVINHLPDGTKTPKAINTPGTAYIRGKKLTTTELVKSDVPITPGSGWLKGGRNVRYYDKSETLKWATRFIRNFTDTGNTNGTANINSVGDIDQWRVGDLLMIVSPTNAKVIRRITSIGGTTITVDSTISFTSGVTLNYYGRTFNGEQRTTAPTDLYGSHAREEEEVAVRLSIPSFSCGGQILSNRGGGRASTNTAVYGVYLSDGSTFMSGSTNLQTSGNAGIGIGGAGEHVRFGFIGTGLSLWGSMGTGDIPITVDGFPAGNLNMATDERVDDDAIFIVGELPYGFHTVEIGYTATGSTIEGITIYQPKKPDIPDVDQPVLELWDVNHTAGRESDLGVGEEDSIETMQIGNIIQEYGAYAHPHGVDSVLRDFALSVNTGAVIAREWDWLSGGSSLNFNVDYVFFGDEITMIYNNIGISAGAINVLFLDHDGQFKAPGSTTGFTSTGLTALVAGPVVGGKNRWTLSELGVHIIRFASTGASNTMDIEAMEIHTPFHNIITQIPRSTDLVKPLQFNGMDIRPLSPVPAHLLPKSSVHTQALALHNTWSFYLADQFPFYFYATGGPVDISVTCNVRNTTGGAISARIAVNFNSIMDAYDINVPLANDEALITMQATFNAQQPGFYFAYVSMSTNDQVKNLHWRATSRSPEINGLTSRGLSSKFVDIANPRESTY
jgi:hypothetical protein